MIVRFMLTGFRGGPCRGNENDGNLMSCNFSVYKLKVELFSELLI